MVDQKHKSIGLFLSAVSMLALAPCAAYAQEVDAGAASTRPADEDNAGEIVVTANKREQSINKVGLAITALSGDSLKSQNIVSLSDLAGAIPGLSYTPSASSTPVFTLRGVGFYETTLGAYPTTSVYLDQSPLPFPALSTHTNFDLERVEVLKGPQGTLFGQNSTGGAINFIAAKPTSTFQAGADITYGRFNRVEANAFVSGPLSETLSARIAFNGAHRDDWQKSYTRDDKLGELNYYAGRILLDWNPASRLKIELQLNAWRDRSDLQAPQYQTLLPQAPPTTSPDLLAYPFAPFNARAADWSPGNRPHSNSRMLQSTLRANWEVVDGIAITALSSYVDYKQRAGHDYDGTTLYLDGPLRDDGIIQSFNQELRVANTAASPVRWVLGANYEWSKVNQEQQSSLVDISTFPLFGYTGTIYHTNQNMRNYAFFGNVEYDLGDQFTVKGGIRYTNARRRADICSMDPGDGTMSRVFDGLTAAIQTGAIPMPGFTPTGVVPPPIGNGCFSLDNVTEDGTPATYLPSGLNDTLKEDNISWRAGAEYKPASNILLYANVARGYKAGSYPIASAATLEQQLPVTQESLLSYEAGFKVSTIDRKLQIVGAGFYYDYKDKQLRGKIIDPIFGVLDALENIPKSRMIGAEVDISYRPVSGLTLGASGSVIGSKITEYIGLDTSGGAKDFAGSVIPYTPKYQLRVTGDYEWNMGTAVPFVGFAVSTRSKAYANIGGARGLVTTPNFASSVPVSDTYTLPGYTLVDLRAGVKFDDDRWSIMVFGKNIFNKYYITNIMTDYDTIGRFAGEPATYGVTIGFKIR